MGRQRSRSRSFGHGGGKRKHGRQGGSRPSGGGGQRNREARHKPEPGEHINPLQPRIDYAGLPRDDEETAFQPASANLPPELVMPPSVMVPPVKSPPAALREADLATTTKTTKGRRGAAATPTGEDDVAGEAPKRGRGRAKKAVPARRGRKSAAAEPADEDATEVTTPRAPEAAWASPYAQPGSTPASPAQGSLPFERAPIAARDASLAEGAASMQAMSFQPAPALPGLHEINPAMLASGAFSIQRIEKMSLSELYEECKQENILDLYSNQKDTVAAAVKRAYLRKHGFMLTEGCLEVLNEGFGFMRPAHNDYLPRPDDVFVSQALIKRHGLRTGHMIAGAVRPPRDNEKYLALVRVDTVNEVDPSIALTKTPFEELTPIYPNQRLVLETGPEILETRIIDLISPIGKGQRGLIVSPPRAGKTVLLQKIANAITKNNPECHLLVLLVDERPEEVTDMERSIRGEVIASTFDEPASRHVQVAHMVIQKAKRMVEFGKDVVILLDSITRLARAHNIETPGSSKILSGGIDAGALQKPKQFFGSARNIEEGGSLTILGTALIDTGSRMDEVIFEEFKGTGNEELVLDRRLADRRVFPALDINMSGTRREDLLMNEDELARVWKLRRFMNEIVDPVEAMDLLLEKMRKTRTNAEFLLSMNVDR